MKNNVMENQLCDRNSIKNLWPELKIGVHKQKTSNINDFDMVLKGPLLRCKVLWGKRAWKNKHLLDILIKGGAEGNCK